MCRLNMLIMMHMSQCHLQAFLVVVWFLAYLAILMQLLRCPVLALSALLIEKLNAYDPDSFTIVS